MSKNNKNTLSILSFGVIFGLACGHYNEPVISTSEVSLGSKAFDGTTVVVTNEFEGQQVTASDIFSQGKALLEKVVTGKPSNIKFLDAPCNDFQLVPLNGGLTVTDTIIFYDGENVKEYWIDYGPGCNSIDQCDSDADCGGGKGFKCVEDRCVPDCTMDSDCHPSDQCNTATKKCEPGEGCNTDEDCPNGQTCNENGECEGGGDSGETGTPPPECMNNTDCPDGETCVNGTCEPPTGVGPLCLTVFDSFLFAKNLKDFKWDFTQGHIGRLNANEDCMALKLSDYNDLRVELNDQVKGFYLSVMGDFPNDWMTVKFDYPAFVAKYGANSVQFSAFKVKDIVVGDDLNVPVQIMGGMGQY